MKILCVECREKKAEYIKNEIIEALGWYIFECECGGGCLVPQESPLIEYDK